MTGQETMDSTTTGQELKDTSLKDIQDAAALMGANDAWGFDKWADQQIESHRGKVRISWSQGSPVVVFSKWVFKDDLDKWLNWSGPPSQCPYPDPFTCTNNQ